MCVIYKCPSIGTLEVKVKQKDTCTYLHLSEVSNSEATPFKKHTEMKAQESKCEH